MSAVEANRVAAICHCLGGATPQFMYCVSWGDLACRSLVFGFKTYTYESCSMKSVECLDCHSEDLCYFRC
jgi:hypothetical protein